MRSSRTGTRYVTPPRRGRTALAAVALITGTLAAIGVVAASPASASGASNTQCANGTSTPDDPCDGAAWQNGNLNNTNAAYREGDSVPQRAIITTTLGGPHSIRINYRTTILPAHAFDYLTDWDRSAGPGANACSGVGPPCVLSPATAASEIPLDTATDGPAAFQLTGQHIAIWNGTITGVNYVGTTYGPDRTLEVHFTVSSTSAVIAWGAHIASELDWGVGTGTSSISGSPYHVDNTGGSTSANPIPGEVSDGSQLSMKANAVIPGPAITTQVSNTTPSTGSTVTDTATVPANATGTMTFYLCGPNATAPDCSTGGTVQGSAVPIASGTAVSPGFVVPSTTTDNIWCYRAEYTPDATAPYSRGSHTNTLTTGTGAECFTAQPVSMGIDKTADASPVNAGDTIGYAITVSNTGTGNATGVAIDDVLPDTSDTWAIDTVGTDATTAAGCAIGLDGNTLHCNQGNLGAGTSVVVHVTSGTDKTDCPGVNNELASASSTNDGSPSIEDVPIVINCATIGIDKSADASPVNAGDGIGYTITVTNTGAGLAHGVDIDDVLPATSGTWAIDTVGTDATTAANCTIANDGNTLHCDQNDLAGPTGSVVVHVTSGTDKTDCPGVNNELATASSTNDGTDTVEDVGIVINCANIGITKTADASPVNAGDGIGYTITVTNTGAGMAHGVDIDDVLPATSGTWAIDTTGADATTAAGCTIGLDGNTLHCDQNDLAGPTGSVIVHVTSGTDKTDCPGVNNELATASSTNDGTDTVEDVGIVINCANIGITKTADASPVNAGDGIGYTITVTNTGAGMAHGVDIDDVLPATSGTWAIDTVGADATTAAGCTIGLDGNTLHCDQNDLAGPTGSVVVHVTSGTDSTDCPGVNNELATASSTNDGGDTVEDVGIVINCANIGITKTADASPVNAGDGIGYTIKVKNNGAGLAHGVDIDDVLPATSGTWAIDTVGADATTAAGCTIAPDGNTLHCEQGDLAAGVEVVVHVTSGTSSTDCPGVNNEVASVTSSNDGPASVEDVGIVINCPNLVLVKSTTTPTVNAGDAISYTLTLTNNGPGVAYNAIIDDTQLSSAGGLVWTDNSASCTVSATNVLHCDVGNMADDAIFTVTVTATTSSANCPSNTLSNTATADADNSDQVSSGNATQIAINCATIGITKTADASPVNAGDGIGYTITVTNTGAGMAHGVDIDDVLPATSGTWAIDTVGADATTAAGCTIANDGNTLHCDQDDLAGPTGSVVVHVTSGTDSTDCPGVNNEIASASSTNTAGSNVEDVRIVINCPNLELKKSTTTPTVNAGDVISYTLTLTNHGPGVAYNAVIDDTQLSSAGGLVWTDNSDSCAVSATNVLHCDVGNMADDAVFTVTVSATTSAANCPSNTLSNTATADADNNDQVSSGTATTIRINCADLGITKTADDDSVTAGDTIGYTITVKNNGAGDAHDVVVTDTLPTNPGLIWTATLSPVTAGTCSSTAEADAPMKCDLHTIAAGATVTITLSSPTGSTTCTDNVIENSASVTTSNAGSAATDTAHPATITVNCADIGLTKTPDASAVDAGSDIGYTITVSNSGAGEARGVVLTDTLPTTDGTSWSVDGGTAQATCQPIVENTLTCNVGTVGPRVGDVDGTATVHITSHTTRGVCATVTNHASVTTTNDSAASTPENGVSITLRCADLSNGLNKTANRTSSGPGVLITYTLTVTNRGTGAARDVVVNEPIPTGTTFDSCSNSCSPQGPLVTSTSWTIAGPIAANGGTASVTLTVKVANTDECLICNTATVTTPDRVGQTTSSNEVCINNTPGSHPEGAHASGKAYALNATAALLAVNNVHFPIANPDGVIDSSVSGVGSNAAGESTANVNVPPPSGTVAHVNALSAFTESEVTTQPAQAVQRSTAEVLGVNLVSGLVKADVVRADATTVADGFGSAFSAGGSTFKNLVVNGVAMNNVAPNTRINLPALLFGANSYVVLFDQVGTTGGPTDGYRADLTVNMIRVHLTSVLGLGGIMNRPAVDIIVGHAVAHSDFPATKLCSARPVQAVSGYAFVASVDTTPSLLPTLIGYSTIPASGGHAHQELPAANVPDPPGATPVVTTKDASTDSVGTTGPGPSTSSSYAQAAGVCVLRTVTGCTISADLIRSQANSSAGPGGASSSDAGTQFVNLRVLGQPVVIPAGKKLVIIAIPGIGYVRLNEQYCDGLATLDSCAGTNHTGLMVRAIHVVVSIPDNPLGMPLGAEVIVAEAHSDATYITGGS